MRVYLTDGPMMLVRNQANDGWLSHPLPQFGFVTGSNFTTSSASLVDITGLTIALPAAGTYVIDAQTTGKSSDANGVKFGVGFTGSTTSLIGCELQQAVGTANVMFAKQSAIATAGVTCWAALTDPRNYGFKGVIRVTTAGTLSLQVQKQTAGTATIYLDSFMQVSPASNVMFNYAT
jgi:hypothetical protein